MFRRNRENKAKLEHKLYLARENPEPVFDLSDCNLCDVPRGIYSLCRVFLKEILNLQNNSLHSLSGGGSLKDLQFLKVLNISDNKFRELTDDIAFLENLEELYASNNHLKSLPTSFCKLEKMTVLDLSDNCLKCLPENIGDLTRLKVLKLNGNKSLHNLPKTICCMQSLVQMDLDCDNFSYPPAAVIRQGTESILKFICDDTGCTYNPSTVSKKLSNISSPAPDTHENILEEEKIKTFLEIERNNELLQQQEFALANISKANRDKLLADIVSQQEKLNSELIRVQHKKDIERFRLIEQLQEAEQKADIAVSRLLNMNSEPVAQLLEQEKKEEEAMVALAMSKYNETFAKNNILTDMEELLNQETERYRLQQTDRSETMQSMLAQELEKDNHLLEVLSCHSSHRAEFIAQLQHDEELQKAAVGALLERGDARSWGLLQQVRLVESQLAALTAIEIDRKKLQLDQHLNDLAEKRSRLSMLLMDLIHQQNERRSQLLSTLQILNENKEAAAEDFWLRQYQGLLNRLPVGISEAQKNLDPLLCQDLLMAGVIHCLPFLAKLTQSKYDLTRITDNELLEYGIESSLERQRILKVFRGYPVRSKVETKPSAPPPEEASAPPVEILQSATTSECVICMDSMCHIIFLPCGHLCCCTTCSSSLTDCPMCRALINHKIRVVKC